MSTKVKNNMSAIRSLNTLNKNAHATQKNLRKVSTGERITSTADDASAYGISERMREKIRSLDQANDNAQNDMAMMRTAEGAVANIVDTLRTLKQKAIDSANDSNTDDDRRVMQKEVDQFIDQIDDNALVTFNGKFLVNGNLNTCANNVGYVLICRGLYKEKDPSNREYSSTPWDVYENISYKLTKLWGRDGTSLGISETDTFTVSHVINGNTYTRTDKVGNFLLNDLITGSKEGSALVGVGSQDNSLPIDYIINVHGSGTVSFSTVWVKDDLEQNLYMAASPPRPADENFYGIPIDNGAGHTRYVIPDKSGQALRAPDINGTVYTLPFYKDPAKQVSSITITIRDAGGNINQKATHALKFTMLQRGESSSSSDRGGCHLRQPSTSARARINQ